MEGIVSQIIFVGLDQILCNLENEVLKNAKSFPFFVIKFKLSLK